MQSTHGPLPAEGGWEKEIDTHTHTEERGRWREEGEIKGERGVILF